MHFCVRTSTQLVSLSSSLAFRCDAPTRQAAGCERTVIGGEVVWPAGWWNERWAGSLSPRWLSVLTDTAVPHPICRTMIGILLSKCGLPGGGAAIGRSAGAVTAGRG
jgi:hypothetical protein